MQTKFQQRNIHCLQCGQIMLIENKIFFAAINKKNNTEKNISMIRYHAFTLKVLVRDALQGWSEDCSDPERILAERKLYSFVPLYNLFKIERYE